MHEWSLSDAKTIEEDIVASLQALNGCDFFGGPAILVIPKSLLHNENVIEAAKKAKVELVADVP